jgi:hypothetical protein
MDSRPLSPSSKVVIVGLAPRLRRSCYRHQIQRLAYLNLDQANGGIIRNLGEAGIAIQAVAPLCPNQEVFLRFDLAQPRVRVQATGRVAWADPAGQAGVEFLSLPQRSRRLLKEWIFIQLLTMAVQATGATYVEGGEQAAELLFSARSRPAIRLEPEVRAAAWLAEDKAEDTQPRSFDLSWFPFAISAPALSRLVDGLILLSAVLLFAVICMVMIGAVPAWPVALILGLGITAVFAALYWFLFWFWIGGTPGSFLAGITLATFDEDIQADDRPRFR